jgi:hypothetical protein
MLCRKPTALECTILSIEFALFYAYLPLSKCSVRGDTFARRLLQELAVHRYGD